MKIKKSSKSSFFKKILLKLVRKLGYEMVDQSNLNIADEDLYIKKGFFCINYCLKNIYLYKYIYINEILFNFLIFFLF